MRKLTIALALVAGLASTAAMAAATTTTGAIKAMDAKACTVTLDSGSVYYFGTKCDFSKLKAGEKVAITWTAKAGKNDASKIIAAS